MKNKNKRKKENKTLYKTLLLKFPLTIHYQCDGGEHRRHAQFYHKPPSLPSVPLFHSFHYHLSLFFVPILMFHLVYLLHLASPDPPCSTRRLHDLVHVSESEHRLGHCFASHHPAHALRWLLPQQRVSDGVRE